MSDFIKLIKLRRAELGLSQVMLAKRSGLSQSAITIYERGLGKPKDSNLTKLANGLMIDRQSLKNLLYPAQKRTFEVPPKPMGSITVSVGGSGGSAQAMTQNGVALTSMEHPQVNPEPVAWVDEIWFKRPDLTSKLEYDDLFSRSKDENYVPLFGRSQIGYTQEQVNRMMDMAAHLERNICAQIAHDTYEGFGAEAKGVDFVKQQIIRQIKERDKL
jgi:DNA-binding XRE family transcriptional regulator